MDAINHILDSAAVQARQEKSYADATDRQLVTWMCEGDTTAFEEIFSRYEVRLVAYAARYINSIDLAKDVCQEVFLKLIAKPPTVLIYDNLGPWLFRVTRNLAIDKRRRRKFEVSGEDVDMPEAKDELSPFQTLSSQNDARVIRKLVQELPPELREIVELRVDGGVSFKDIATILDIPQGTALWRMHRAIEVLRQQWRNYEPKL